MKSLLLLFPLLFASLVLAGQNLAEPDGKNNKDTVPRAPNAVSPGTVTDYWSVLNEGVTPPSPNAASLGMFGNIPIDLYKGTARYDIPLYTLKSAHLELPITLGYASNGLRVDEIASNIGLGWALFTGGIISRTVYQNADEKASYRFKSVWVEGNYSPFSPSNPYRDVLADYIWHTGGSDYNETDGQPDIFQFNAPGISGSFVLNEQMTPQVIKGNGLVKIEFNQTESQFTITDTRGLKYYYTATEINLSNSNPGSERYKYLDSPLTIMTPPRSLSPVKAATTAWFITKIVHPQGDSLAFEYNTGDETYNYGYHEEIRAFTSSDRLPGESNDSKLLKHMMTYGYKKGEKRTRYIKKITATNGVTIEFGYTTGSRQDMLSGGVLLTSLTVKYQSAVIKKFTFTQVAKQSAKNTEVNLNGLAVGSDIQYRYFLTKVSEKSTDDSKEIIHTFEYNNLDNLPNRFLRAQDYGGFYNGSTANRLAPCVVSGSGTNVQVTADDINRIPNWQYAQKGVLNKITYPTGGTTLITYEANQERTEVHPGIRVSQTEDVPGGNAPSVVRKYYYNDYAERNSPLAGQGLSKYEFIDQTENYYFRPCNDFPEPPYYTYKYTMYYSSAKNYFNEVYTGLPYYPIVTVSYGGTNFEQGGKTTFFRNEGYSGCSYLANYQIKFGVIDNSAMYNGEKEREVTFKVEGDTPKILTDKQYIYREITTYSRNCLVTDNQFPDEAPLCGGNNPSLWEKAVYNYSIGQYKIYGKVLLLDKAVATTNDQNGQNPVEETVTYAYNGLYQRVSITTSGSDGKARKDSIRYVSDYFGVSSSSPYYSVFNTLKNRNAIDYPVELVRYTGSNVVYAHLNLYGAGSNGGVNVTQEYVLPVTAPVTSHTYFNGSSYASGYKKIWDLQYNTGNKLKEATYKGVQKKAYVWGYQNCYVVAEIENASFSALGVSDQPLSDALPSGNENTIRALSNTLVTTYTYKPQVGMATVTDPALRTTYYDYDLFGRLKESYLMESGTKKILQSYDYNYFNQ